MARESIKNSRASRARKRALDPGRKGPRASRLWCACAHIILCAPPPPPPKWKSWICTCTLYNNGTSAIINPFRTIVSPKYTRSWGLWEMCVLSKIKSSLAGSRYDFIFIYLQIKCHNKHFEMYMEKITLWFPMGLLQSHLQSFQTDVAILATLSSFRFLLSSTFFTYPISYLNSRSILGLHNSLLIL